MKVPSQHSFNQGSELQIPQSHDSYFKDSFDSEDEHLEEARRQASRWNKAPTKPLTDQSERLLTSFFTKKSKNQKTSKKGKNSIKIDYNILEERFELPSDDPETPIHAEASKIVEFIEKNLKPKFSNFDIRDHRNYTEFNMTNNERSLSNMLACLCISCCLLCTFGGLGMLSFISYRFYRKYGVLEVLELIGIDKNNPSALLQTSLILFGGFLVLGLLICVYGGYVAFRDHEDSLLDDCCSRLRLLMCYYGLYCCVYRSRDPGFMFRDLWEERERRLKQVVLRYRHQCFRKGAGFEVEVGACGSFLVVVEKTDVGEEVVVVEGGGDCDLEDKPLIQG